MDLEAAVGKRVIDVDRSADGGRDAQSLGLGKGGGEVLLVLIGRAAEHDVAGLGVGDLVSAGGLGLHVAVELVCVERCVRGAKGHRAVGIRGLGVLAHAGDQGLLNVVLGGIVQVHDVERELRTLEGLVARVVGLGDGQAVARALGAGVGLGHLPVLAVVLRSAGKAVHRDVVADVDVIAQDALRAHVIGDGEGAGIGHGEGKDRGRAAVGGGAVAKLVRDALGHLGAGIGVLDVQRARGEARAGVHGVLKLERAGGADGQGVGVDLNGEGDVGVIGSALGRLVQDLVGDGGLGGAGREGLCAGICLGAVRELLALARLEEGGLDGGLVRKFDVALPRIDGVCLGPGVLCHGGGLHGEDGLVAGHRGLDGLVPKRAKAAITNKGVLTRLGHIRHAFGQGIGELDVGALEVAGRLVRPGVGLVTVDVSFPLGDPGALLAVAPVVSGIPGRGAALLRDSRHRGALDVIGSVGRDIGFLVSHKRGLVGVGTGRIGVVHLGGLGLVGNVDLSTFLADKALDLLGCLEGDLEDVVPLALLALVGKHVVGAGLKGIAAVDCHGHVTGELYGDVAGKTGEVVGEDDAFGRGAGGHVAKEDLGFPLGHAVVVGVFDGVQRLGDIGALIGGLVRAGSLAAGVVAVGRRGHNDLVGNGVERRRVGHLGVVGDRVLLLTGVRGKVEGKRLAGRIDRAGGHRVAGGVLYLVART